MSILRTGCFLLLAALPLFAGITYEAETKVTQDNKKPTTSLVRAYVDGGKAHIDFLESSNPMAKSGSWVLTLDGGQTMIMVDPKEKTYMTWDVSKMFSLLGSMGEMMNFKFSDVKVEKLEESDGDKIHGKATRRFKHHISYGLDMKIMGMTTRQLVDTEQETWNTTDIPDLGMGAWLRTMPATGIEGLDKLVKESVKDVKGIPLRSKSLTVTTQLDKKGNKKREQRSVSETQVTKLQEGAVDASLFEIPAGYQKIELPAEGENGMPSLKNLFGK